MKKCIFLALLLIPIISFSQENKRIMTIEEGKIYYDGLKIRISEAKDLALSSDNMPAYEYFKSAKKIKGWNVLWAVLGGYELAGGALTAISGNPIGLLDLGLGAGLIIMTSSRERKADRKLYKGVEAFNK